MVSTSDFVSLHNHTHNSLLDGLSNEKEYLARVQELGQTGFGVTDHGNVFGLYSFLEATNDLGITGVPGCEFYLAPENENGALLKEGLYYGDGGSHDVSARGAYLHLTVWAYNKTGLHNLFKLSSLSYEKKRFFRKPRIDFGLLAKYNEGLIVSSGCPSSEISTRFLLGQDDKAYEYADKLKSIFGPDRFFIEIMNHNMDSTDIERILLPKQLKISKDMGIELLATNDCHYAESKDSHHHEEMLCIQSGSFMSELPYDKGGKRFAFDGTEYYLKSAHEMLELFPQNEFPNAITNTRRVAEMVENVKLDFDNHLRPNPNIPDDFQGNEAEFYRHLVKEGLKERYGHASPDVQQEAIRRSNQEFEVIHSSDFIGYMLVVRDYLQWTKDQFSTVDKTGQIVASPIGAGRGSVGGSIHAFVLGISEVDPIKHDLLFERFLSAGRGSTYEITYDDGTTEEIIVSGTKSVLTENGLENKYIHQLNIGDTVKE